MRLSKLLRSVRVYSSSVADFGGVEVGGISTDSRTVSPGDVFVAIDGMHSKGADFIPEAIARGARFVVCEESAVRQLADTAPGAPDGDRAAGFGDIDGGTGRIGYAVVGDARRAAAVMWSNLFGSPGDGMEVICVTGTCGKSSVSSVLYHVLSSLGERAGLIGTLGASACGRTLCMDGESELPGFPSAMTTPDPKFLYGALAEMRLLGCRFAVVEASSHAIAQRKLAALSPRLSVFTNLSPEHLDFHGNMENYLLAKAALFAQSDSAVLNADDAASHLVATFIPSGRAATVSASDGDYTISDAVTNGLFGVEYTLSHRDASWHVSFPLAGDFSVVNSAMALACAIELGADASEAVAALASALPLCGRMEVLYRGPFTVMRDFAHTPEAMRRALEFIRRQTSGRVVCVFGCGGDRDRTKRAPMGQIAAELADVPVVTSDNPRTEDPEAIISDILRSAQDRERFKVIPDRRSAIRYALSVLSPGDTAILLGKGHETWEIDMTGKHHFDEREIVREILGE